MIWAWEVDGLTSTTKLVLLSLAQHANEDGAHSFPSVATIAAECRLSERSVQGALKTLEAEGYITVVRRLRQTSLFTLRMDLHVVAKRSKPGARKGAGDSPYPANAAGWEGAGDSPPPRSSCTPTPQQLHPNLSLNQYMNQQDACAQGAEGSEAFDALFGIAPASAAAPAPQPVRNTPQQPPPPGWKAPFNPTPRHINYPPIPPEPAGDPQRWMPRLADPEHRWAVLAPGEEIDPRSMTGARRQARGAWILRDLAERVADLLGWTADPRRYIDWRPLCAWLDDGIDPLDVVIPTIRRVVERRGNVEISTLAYFDRAVREAAAAGRRMRAG